MGDTPLFVPRYAPHRDTTVAGLSGFMLQLRQKMDQPAAASPQEAVKNVVERYRATVQAFGPRERTEWGLIVRLVRRQVSEPIAVEAGLEHILRRLAANQQPAAADPRNHQAPFLQLQGLRRDLLNNLMEHNEFDAVYRYTRDNAVNAPLRQHYGKDNVPADVMATPRPRLGADGQVRGRSPYQPIAGLTTGDFISSLDRALRTLRDLQGEDTRTLFRATLFRKPWVDAMAQSGQYMDHGYVSTSRYTEKLPGFFRNEWSTRFDDEVPVLMVFETSKGVDISCLSRFPNESEHILGRGEQFHARFLGSRRDLCPGVSIPDSENWAVFAMTDDGHEPAAETLRTLQQLGAEVAPGP
jgi:hypothetical protein